ncbi:hypothetical protein BDP81DRAFT_132840 [Colletotrichum phormii]|uniref:Uncharacterized protein n=1 Tax=Colletotrichum phormii TaxID=359342 RepID=A0AAJ0EIB1_9PEZI|nr:uncharacterized protein BDP81DRAFT_132840 [Colletotrichum phormii]KAK1641392.1 hypothetical protein BDP81DRAFT_132840 [Colletotrichum phormii]
MIPVVTHQTMANHPSNPRFGISVAIPPPGPSPGICHAILVRQNTWRATPSTSPSKLCVAMAWCNVDLQMQFGTWIKTCLGHCLPASQPRQKPLTLRTYPRIAPTDTIENAIPFLTRWTQLGTSWKAESMVLSGAYRLPAHSFLSFPFFSISNSGPLSTSFPP